MKTPSKLDAKMEEAALALWENLTACQEGMRDPFPTHWDAFWYGTFSMIFLQMLTDLGNKEVARIVGKKQLKTFIEEHEALVADMFESCHREDSHSEFSTFFQNLQPNK